MIVCTVIYSFNYDSKRNGWKTTGRGGEERVGRRGCGGEGVEMKRGEGVEKRVWKRGCGGEGVEMKRGEGVEERVWRRGCGREGVDERVWSKGGCEGKEKK